MTNNNLLKKFFTFFYGSGIGLLIGLVTTFISTRLLPPEDFGKASMFTLSVNLLMIFILFGTDQAFVRFFYEENKELRPRLLLNTMRIPTMLFLLIFSIIFIFRDQIMILILNENDLKVLAVLISSIAFQFLYRFALLVIRMQQKGHLYSSLEILNKSLNLILLVILYYIIGPRYQIIIYSIGITLIVVTIVAIRIEKEFWKPSSIITAKTRHSQSDIFKFSYPLLLTTLITWLFESFDKIALRQWTDFEELGLYSAAFKIVALLNVVQASFSTFWSPVCYEHFEKHPDDQEFFSMTSKIIGLIMFTIGVLSILFKDVIVMLLGTDYKQAATIMPFLIFMPMMYTLSETTVIGINFFKKTKYHILIAGISGLINILGNIALVPLYGAEGAALSTGISFIIFFLMRTHISKKYYPVKYGLKRVYLLIGLIFGYALINMFWPYHLFTYLTGALIIIFILMLYIKELKFISRIIIKNRKV
ncbi:oligosaccharide flippase family protein [Mesobacillus subterraneus]|uniref:lipopolysaccharide biosynthesis protein n=1 Tax=Mesobacillus subterraneus TaxID=285983 RepID=UPI001CFE3631|nr:oligosaccharide flippase family protein [Mesobacillus subterraneus]WLR55472.1 oligosaccharide flippase family protein [Mesobacillus subterraneus]